MDRPSPANMRNARGDLESQPDDDSEDDSEDDSGDDSEDDDSSSDDDDRSPRRVFIEENLNQFPCTFNIGRANYNFGGLAFNQTSIRAASGRDVCWGIFVEDVIIKSKDDHWEPLTWLQNLRIRAYVELGRLEEARNLVTEILYRTDNENITTLANSAVLHFVDGKVAEAMSVVRNLNGRPRLRTFRYLKADAICEQAFIFFVFSGAVNNLSAIELLKFALRESCIKNRTEALLMLGTLYRRCLHWNNYEVLIDRIDFCEFAIRAYDTLNCLRNDPDVQSKLKGNAVIELAFLQHDITQARDVDIQGLQFKGSVVELCNEAVSLLPGSAKVLSTAGQLLKYIPGMTSKAKYFLEKSIEIRPSARGFHHLGLILLREAGKFEETHPTEHAMNHDHEISTFSITRIDNLRINNIELIVAGDRYFRWASLLFRDSEDFPLPPRDIELQQESHRNEETRQPRILLANNIDWVIDSIVAEGRRMPSFRCNNPHIQIATEYLRRYINLSEFEQNLPIITRLGFAYMKCRRYALAFNIFEKFYCYDTDEIPGIILAYGYKMLTFCSLLNWELRRSELEKRFMRELSVCFLKKAVCLFADISDNAFSQLTPTQILEFFRNIPPFHRISPRRFPTLQN